MSVETNNYATQNLHGDVMDNGVQKVMMNASIRTGKYLQIHVEVLDAEYAEANKADVAEAVNAFLVNAFDAAADNGLPIEGGK